MRPLQPPIFDQGPLGSCTGNGIAGELEAQALAQGLKLQTMSRLFIYYNERDMEGTTDQDAGADIRDGIKSVNQTGACFESEWPYDISKFTQKPPAKAGSFWSGAPTRNRTWIFSLGRNCSIH